VEARKIGVTTNKLNEAINERHYEKEGPDGVHVRQGIFDVVIDTHDLAMANQRAIQGISTEQKLVNEKLDKVERQVCPLHQENRDAMAEITRRLDIDDKEPK
jgi:hypothetical protein